MFNKTYQDPNPAIGQQGTKLTTTDMNTIVSELNAILTSHGVNPDNSSGQISNLLNKTFAPLNSPTLTGTPLTSQPGSSAPANQIATVDYVNQKAMQATVGFTPVQQGGGDWMANNKVYIGWTGSELIAQVDQTQLGGFVFQQEDDNTYGIRKIGFNHVAGTTSAQDSSGTWHYLAEQNWVQGQYLPLIGGEISGSLKVDQSATIGGISLQQDSSTSAHVISNAGDHYYHSISLDNDIYRTDATTWSQGTGNIMTFTDFSGHFMFRDSSTTGDMASRVLSLAPASSTLYSPLAVSGSLTANDITTIGQATIGKALSVGASSGGTMGIELGDTTNGQNNTTYLDFHSFGVNHDFDARISASGGSASATGQASLNFQAANAIFSCPLSVSGKITAGALTTPNLTSNLSIIDNGSDWATIYLSNSGKNRWTIGKSNAAETGNNAGGDLVISAYSDSNTLLSTPLTISRNSGIVSVGTGLQVPTVSTSDNSKNAASTSFVHNYVGTITNQTLQTSSTPTFQGAFLETLAFNNGGNSSVYQDTNQGNIVIHTNNGSDHFAIFNPDGSLNLGGNITSGQATINGAAIVNGDVRVGQGNWLYTNTIGSYNGTVAVNAGLTVNGNLNIGGEAWYQTHGNDDNGTHIATTAFAHNVANQKANDVQSWVNSQGYGTTNWVNANYVPWSSYQGDFGSSGNIWNFAYGNRMEPFQVNATDNQRINFPQSFSSAPYAIVITPAQDIDVDCAAYNWDAGGFTIRVVNRGATQFSIVAYGPK